MMKLTTELAKDASQFCVRFVVVRGRQHTCRRDSVYMRTSNIDSVIADVVRLLNHRTNIVLDDLADETSWNANDGTSCDNDRCHYPTHHRFVHLPLLSMIAARIQIMTDHFVRLIMNSISN
jgi:hypothetical protein